MRKTILIISTFLILSTQFILAQTNTFPTTGSAGIGILIPNTSALLEMVSTTKGILIPRMTKTQRDAIVSPATGLLIYQKNSTPGFYYYSGSAWISMNSATYTSGSGISISGTTITNTGDINASDDLLSTTIFNGDVSGTFSTLQIVPGAILGTDLNDMGASTGKVLKWSGTSWAPGTDIGLIYSAGSGISIAGSSISNTSPDQVVSLTGIGSTTITGTYPNFTISTPAGLIGSGTAIGNTMYWSGSSWVVSSSNLFNDGSKIGIGTSTPLAKLDVAEDILVNGITVGRGGLGESDNTVVGYEALNSITSGSGNTVVGYKSLNLVKNGNDNTAIGYNTLNFTDSNTTGNTAVGERALWECVTGTSNYNTAIGHESMKYNYGGSYNTAIGHYALNDNSGGEGNVAIGSSALSTSHGISWNVAIGYNSMWIATSGFGNNTVVGAYSGLSPSNITNASAFGYEATVDASNKVRIGNSSISSNGGQVSWTAYSDERIKENIQENIPGLEFINELRPITYHFNITKENALLGINDSLNWQGKYDIEKIQFSGFIAQEVDAAANKIGYDFSGIDKSGNIWGLRYAEFVVPLVKSVQEMDKENTLQGENIDSIQMQIIDQKNDIEDLKKEIEVLKSIINHTQIYDGAVELKLNEKEPAILGQNIPNPFDKSTLIPFRIPIDCKDASIIITDASAGKVVKVIPVVCSETNINVKSDLLTSGFYTYSLFVDGKLIDTKQMIITK